MNICKSRSWLAVLVGVGLSCLGLARANTVSATADPLPNQTLTISTITSTTTTETRVQTRGTVVRLQATPSPGHQFLGWGNACTGTASACTVTMSSDRTVTARFGPVLTVAVAGTGKVTAVSGGIDCGADCTEPYPYGTNVTLSATPAAGQVFAGWGGNCSGMASVCTVTMNAAKNVTAAFTAAPVVNYPLNVTVTGSGTVGSSPAGISCGSACSANFASNTSVTLTATPAAGQAFNGWSGACAGVASTCTVSMTAARSVGATFSVVVASGPVYYFSDCQAGAVAGCVPGNNANAGTNPAAPKQNLTGIDVNALPAGTQLLFAKGGAWTEFGMILTNPNVTAAQPLVFAPYATSWGGNNRPWLTLHTGLRSVFIFGWYNEAQNDGGYTLRGLKLDGLGLFPESGIFIANNVHDVLLEDLEITGFGIGIQATQNGQYATQYTVRNSNIHHNSRMGLLGDGTNVLIEGNLFEANNFSGSAFNHAIYLGGHGLNGTVRNNRFVRNSVLNGKCTGGNVTVHGQWDGLLIENNSIEQDASELGCYGFSITSGYDSAEYFRKVVVRNNRVLNLGGCGVCLNSAPGAVVENNLIVNTQATFHAAIAIPANTAGPGDDADGGALVRNNTVVLTRAAAWNDAIALRNNSGSGVRVVSNIVYLGAGSDPQASCFSHQALSNYPVFDNNLCFSAGGTAKWSQTYATLAAAKAAGFDPHGLAADPLFMAGVPSLANDWQDQLLATSPAHAAAHATLSTTADRLGTARPVPATIGAREVGATIGTRAAGSAARSAVPAVRAAAATR